MQVIGSWYAPGATRRRPLEGRVRGGREGFSDLMWDGRWGRRPANTPGYVGVCDQAGLTVFRVECCGTWICWSSGPKRWKEAKMQVIGSWYAASRACRTCISFITESAQCQSASLHLLTSICSPSPHLLTKMQVIGSWYAASRACRICISRITESAHECNPRCQRITPYAHGDAHHAICSVPEHITSSAHLARALHTSTYLTC